MAASDTYAIVGGGLAGGKAAEALRAQGFDGRLVLIGAESHLPYERPPLSKGYLAGNAERDSMLVHDQAWYDEQQVELVLGTEVSAIDRSAGRLSLGNGDELAYHKLLLATGASPRSLPLPGSDAEGVYYLRSVEESDRLRDLFGRISRLVVIGAGWIGLEVTAAARGAGVQVTVIESAELPLLRVLGPEVAQVFAQLHREHEVDLRLSASIAEITTDGGRATGVRLADGTTFDADAVLVAVGVAPNIGLAERAGLATNNGIVVDQGLRTEDLNIFAAGDVANAFHPRYAKHIRVEHWANALKQPAVAAASMLGGQAGYEELPYFYTDQYDLGMEYLGYVEPGEYDRVLFRGDVGSREFIAFWLRGGRVLAGMNVNVWDVTDPIKALIRSGAEVDPDRLADPAQPLESL
ncbi:MAG TPA: FAD-dependent oxidoreductase [Jatrophihabitans sp.]|nr:FAD-dependent oxidoreductase [Jatrophihabitans sp.]